MTVALGATTGALTCVATGPPAVVSNAFAPQFQGMLPLILLPASSRVYLSVSLSTLDYSAVGGNVQQLPSVRSNVWGASTDQSFSVSLVPLWTLDFYIQQLTCESIACAG